MPALDSEGFYIGTGSFGDPQPVERQQCYQRVLGRGAQPSPAAAAAAGWAPLARLAMEDEAEAYLDAVRVDLVGWQAVEGADRFRPPKSRRF
jgi:hypothetical protein